MEAVTIDDMMGVACGILGYTPQVFWEITPRETQNALNGYRQKEEAEWERVRWMAYYAASPYADKSFKPEDIWLPIDQDLEDDDDFQSHGEVKRLSKEELKKVYQEAGLQIKESQLNKLYGQG